MILSPAPRKKSSRKAAVALKYDRETMTAPRVVAKGRGLIADRLIGLARQNGVPIVEDKLLVEMLDSLNVNQDIPGELYQVIAEILVAVYRAENARKVKL